MEKIYEIQRIKQIVQEVEERHIIRCPEDAAKVAAHFIGDDDREVFFVMCVFVNNKLSQSDHFKSEPLLESEFP
ncbi:hypothetical protein [Geobacillus thermodenitrificans]|nr:hypothetical protein [Geobacillus thermodenitrificans]